MSGTTRELSIEDALAAIEARRAAGKLDAATAMCRQVLEQVPDSAAAQHLMGLILFERDDQAAGIALVERAAAAMAGVFQPRFNLARMYMLAGDPVNALAALEVANELEPDNAEARQLHVGILTTLGSQAMGDNRLGEAREALDCALALQPDAAESHRMRAYTRYMAGDYAGAFAEYEWRWRDPDFVDNKPALPGPEWDGADPAGKRVAIYPEQGLGDTIQFCRYLPLLGQRGARVQFGVPPSLRRLFASLPNVEHLVAPGDRFEAIDCHLPLLSLPHRFATTLVTVPAGVPYLQAPADAVAAWRERLAGLTGYRVGLVWAGAARHPQDAARSMTPADLAPLAALDGVDLVSLQIGKRAGEVAAFGPGGVFDVTGAIADFADTAAAIANLDVVVSVDTAVAHLAGAVAAPVFVMLPTPPEWRWMHAGTDTPWYPTMTLFRQRTAGEWAPVATAVAAALNAAASDPRACARWR